MRPDESAAEGAPAPLQLVSDLMTRRVRSVRPTTPLRDVIALMQQLHVRHMPVVDERRRLRGLISHRDLVAAHFMVAPAEAGEQRNAGQVMTRDVEVTSADECLHCAAAHMFERKRGCLPVVDKERRLLGILTESDFVRAFRDGTVCLHVETPEVPLVARPKA
jgi:CBS domain-containing membrane protein